MAYWNNGNECPHLYFDHDGQIIYTMCTLHPEKVFGMRDEECQECENYQKVKTHSVIFSLTDEEYDKLIQVSARKHITVTDVIRTGLVEIGVL